MTLTLALHFTAAHAQTRLSTISDRLEATGLRPLSYVFALILSAAPLVAVRSIWLCPTFEFDLYRNSGALDCSSRSGYSLPCCCSCMQSCWPRA